MNRSVSFLGPIGILGVGLLIAAAGVWPAANTAQAQTPAIKIVPASQTVDISGGNFTVDIVVEDVSNLGSFEFKLKINPAIIRLVGVEEGPFLGSTGRHTYCPAPTYSQPVIGAPADTLDFGCATTGLDIAAPSGSGTLATVTFAPRSNGTSPIALIASNEVDKGTGPTDIWGNAITVDSSGAEVTVVGSGPEPARDRDEPTPIPTSPPPPPKPSVTPPDYSWLAPEPGETPMTRPIDGSYMTGASTGSSGGEAQATAGGSPRAGEGPPEKDAAWWPMLIGGLFAAAGVSLLPLAAYLRGASLKRRT
jgi:hypothetical protein